MREGRAEDEILIAVLDALAAMNIAVEVCDAENFIKHLREFGYVIARRKGDSQ